MEDADSLGKAFFTCVLQQTEVPLSIVVPLSAEAHRGTTMESDSEAFCVVFWRALHPRFFVTCSLWVLLDSDGKDLVIWPEGIEIGSVLGKRLFLSPIPQFKEIRDQSLSRVRLFVTP